MINKGKSIKLIHTTKYIKSKLAQKTIRDRIERVMGKYQLIVRLIESMKINPNYYEYKFSLR